MHITDEYKDFAIRKSQCKECSIYDHYKQVGQSEGNAENPTFMFVGEALGKDEAEQVRPFIGRAGKRLRAELKKHANVFNKHSSIISNLLPCRPLNNRFPTTKSTEQFQIREPNDITRTTPATADAVITHCADRWLFEEIKLLKPKILVLLGSQALRFIRNELGITAHRGSWKFVPRLRAWSLATYHPSYVMRTENTEDKGYVAEQFAQDIEKVVNSWHFCERDPRMRMTHEELQAKEALGVLIDFKFPAAERSVERRHIDWERLAAETNG